MLSSSLMKVANKLFFWYCFKLTEYYMSGKCFCRGKMYRIRECGLMVLRYLEIRIKEYELVVLISIDGIKKRKPTSGIWIYGLEI